MGRYLVVANQTLGCDELVARLDALRAEPPCSGAPARPGDAGRGRAPVGLPADRPDDPRCGQHRARPGRRPAGIRVGAAAAARGSRRPGRWSSRTRSRWRVGCSPRRRSTRSSSAPCPTGSPAGWSWTCRTA